LNIREAHPIPEIASPRRKSRPHRARSIPGHATSRLPFALAAGRVDFVVARRPIA